VEKNEVAYTSYLNTIACSQRTANLQVSVSSSLLSFLYFLVVEPLIFVQLEQFGAFVAARAAAVPIYSTINNIFLSCIPTYVNFDFSLGPSEAWLDSNADDGSCWY
jgi:hypothetical protein